MLRDLTFRHFFFATDCLAAEKCENGQNARISTLRATHIF